MTGENNDSLERSGKGSASEMRPRHEVLTTVVGYGSGYLGRVHGSLVMFREAVFERRDVLRMQHAVDEEKDGRLWHEQHPASHISYTTH